MVRWSIPEVKRLLVYTRSVTFSMDCFISIISVIVVVYTKSCISTSINIQKWLISWIHFVLCPNSDSWGIYTSSGVADKARCLSVLTQYSTIDDDFVDRVKAEIPIQHRTSNQVHFLICETCFWCASLISQVPDHATILNWHTCKEKRIYSYMLV